MADETMIITVNKGTKSQWNNQVRAQQLGEPGFATDTRELKIGDGTSSFGSLRTLLEVNNAANIRAALEGNTSLSAGNAAAARSEIPALATEAEAIAGTNTAKVITPAAARAAMGAAPAGGAATIFVNPTDADLGERYASFTSGGVTPQAGLAPLYALYGATSNQAYCVSTRKIDNNTMLQTARLVANTAANYRWFERRKSGNVWGKWTEMPLLDCLTVSLYVDGENGDDETGNGSAALPYQTIQRAFDRVSYAFLKRDSYINILPGTYVIESPLSLKNITGARIAIQGTDESSHSIIQASGSFEGNELMNAQYVNCCFIQNIVFDRNVSKSDATASQNGLYLTETSLDYSTKCKFINAYSGLYIERVSSVYIRNGLFQNCVYGFRCLFSSTVNYFDMTFDNCSSAYSVDGGIAISTRTDNSYINGTPNPLPGGAANLTSAKATDVVWGMTRYATSAEVIAGTSGALAVSPSTLFERLPASGTWKAVNGATTLPAGGTWVWMLINSGTATTGVSAGGTSIGAAGSAGFAWKIK
jgi:hypothetical protein